MMIILSRLKKYLNFYLFIYHLKIKNFEYKEKLREQARLRYHKRKENINNEKNK